MEQAKSIDQLLDEDEVTTGLRLTDFPAKPRYNIKAVVQATGVRSSTLRAWERRYQVCQPHRTASGYRLYSDRDIALIRWLKRQVDAGMAISQAVVWLDALAEGENMPEGLVLPGANEERVQPLKRSLIRPANGQDSENRVDELVSSLLQFDERGAGQHLTEAFALYPVEYVGEQLILPALVEIGERWDRSQVSITQEHFATNLLLHRLSAVLHTAGNSHQGPRIWVACSPAELHEVGAILLTIYLRRAGYQVQYLGKDIPVADLVNEVQRERPALVLLSATTREAVNGLRQLTAALAQLGASAPLIGYGGQAFCDDPEMRKDITGIYMGDSADEALERVDQLLRQKG